MTYEGVKTNLKSMVPGVMLMPIAMEIMMEALTLRGLQETDTIKPEDRKSENRKL